MNIPKFSTPILVTASSAIQYGDRAGNKLASINGDRKGVGTYFALLPSKLVVTFKTEIRWLDVTVWNVNYSAPVSVSGLGIQAEDVRQLIDPALKAHTRRFELPGKFKGSLTFETKGGQGRMILYDISGFLLTV